MASQFLCTSKSVLRLSADRKRLSASERGGRPCLRWTSVAHALCGVEQHFDGRDEYEGVSLTLCEAKHPDAGGRARAGSDAVRRYRVAPQV